MKKLFSLLTLTVLLISLTACAVSTVEKSSCVNDAPASSEQPVFTPSAQKKEEPVIIETACGPIEGIETSEYRVFKGIRYATADRWSAPVAVTKWENTYDATEFGDWACQFKGFFGVEDSTVTQFYYDEATVHPTVNYSEDCLNLNIWTPTKPKDCPVIIFIHGGAFVTGGNSDSFIDGAAYAERDVILVSINYRLGPFAAVYGDGLTGDYQMLDQIAAIRWVKDNISAYGGDPDRITIMGESAGALSVQNILLSPLSEGLVQGAIMMSGGGDLSSLGTPTQPEPVQEVWQKVKEKYSAEDMQKLKELPALMLYTSWLNAYAQFPQYAISATAPILNGQELTMNVKTALENGALADIPCIFGTMSEDMYPYLLYTAAMEYGTAQAAAQKAPVYVYHFDRQLPGDTTFGAYHGGDLWYAFGTLERNWRPFDEIDQRISSQMIDYFSNFAKVQNPNDSSLPAWNPVTEQKQESLRFGDASAEMYAASLEALQTTQNTRPAFPHK